MRRRNNRWKVPLTAAALAFAPLVGLNLLLWLHIGTHGREDMRDAATSMLQLAESRLDEAMTQIIGFGLNGEHTCTPETLLGLSETALKMPFAIEVSIVDPTGKVACVPAGEPRLLRTLSAELDTAHPNVKFTLVDFGDGSGSQAVRLMWRFPDGWGLSAVIPGDELIPKVVLGRLQADFVARLTLVDGRRVSTRLSRAEMEIDGASAFDFVAPSDRYPVALSVHVPSSSLWASYGRLFVWGNAGGLVLAFFSVAVAIGVARQMEGPERAIENSIRRGDFIPYYQPLVDISSGKLLGCEVLIRRRRADGGVDAPGAFIRTVEDTGQIFEITRNLMSSVRDELSPFYASRPHLKVSFNLVADHFADLDIVADVQTIFGDSRIKPHQLILEVTERQPLPNLARARVVIARLQEFGARVALDDVGTGHGGLSYLLKLGVDQMKVDKMFIDAIGTDRYSAAIVDTLVKLAEELSIEFVAEGVETFEQVEYLRARGVKAAQGFVFAPPLSGPLFLDLVAALDPQAAAPSDMVKKAIRGREKHIAA